MRTMYVCWIFTQLAEFEGTGAGIYILQKEMYNNVVILLHNTITCRGVERGEGTKVVEQ